MTVYTYMQEREPGLYSVGYRDLRGVWWPVSYHRYMDAAANHAEFLNRQAARPGEHAPGTLPAAR